LCVRGWINGLDFEIKKLGIYYSRYGYLFLFNVDDIIEPKELQLFTNWFEDRIHEYYEDRSASNNANN
jgi:hypothetical protein